MRVLIRLALVCLLAFAAPAQADSMRCKGRLISEGDTRSLVRARCGTPTEVQTRTILRRAFSSLRGRFFGSSDSLVEIPVETWTYNFGPYKLMRRVIFIDGLVEEIETLEHGFHETPEPDNRESRDNY